MEPTIGEMQLLTQLKDFLAPYKIYIAIAILTALISLWLYDRHSQYEKGKQWCQLQEAKLEMKKAPAAVKKADEARKDIETIQSNNQKDLVALDEASSKANRSCEFAYTDDELFILNRKIREANAATSGNGTVRNTGRTNSNITSNKGSGKSSR